MKKQNKHYAGYALAVIITAGVVAAGSSYAHGLRGDRTFGMGEVPRHNFTAFSPDDMQAHLDELVAEGKITEEAAAEKIARMEEHQAEQQAHHEALAAFLGVTMADLDASREARVSLEDVAAEQGISADALHTFMQEQHQAEMQERLAQMVADGKLTQEEADQKLEALQNGEKVFLMHGDMHGKRGMWFKDTIEE